MLHRRMIPLLVVMWWMSLVSVTYAVATPRCFTETGFCISGDIRTFWEQNGALTTFGLPITAPVQSNNNGVTVIAQQFERIGLEYHSDIAEPYTVQLTLLGADALARATGVRMAAPSDRAATDAAGRAKAARADCLWFDVTQQYVCGEFYTHWRSHGLQIDGSKRISYAESLALFGLPISDVFAYTINGTSYEVQFFERARFEYHPENPVPYRVLTGLLGSEALRTTATTPTTVAVPPTPTTPPTTILPDSDLATYRNNMPTPGYWNSAVSDPIVIAVSEMHYTRNIDIFVAPKGKKYVVALYDIINNRTSGGASIQSDFNKFTIIDFEGVEHYVESITYQLNNTMQLKDIAPGQRYGGEIAFLIPETSAVAQVKVYFPNMAPITVELRVWPKLP